MSIDRRTLLLACALWPAGRASAGPRGETTMADARADLRQTFMSGGRSIAVEIFAAQAGARRPAVLMLHGADGLSSNTQYRKGAAAIAAAGHPVFLVHYLDRTAERRASFASVFQNFPDWVETVRDAIDFVARHPAADPDRIGLVGISLGAALGLAVAGSEPRIRALVDYFGPLPQGAVSPTRRLPPTLILHGGADPIVPVANAYAIEALLREQGAPSEMKVYPGQGHGFRGSDQHDATRRVLSFLRRHLDPGLPRGTEGV
jgi:carboxymethylenebutenolidase